MKKRNQKRILRIEPLLALNQWTNGSSGLHFVLSFVLGVALCVLQWTGQKSETFHRHFIAVSDRVAGDCKVLIVLCICILFAMWIKKASLLFIYIYILRYVMMPILPNLLRCSSICILRYFSTLAKEII